MVTRFSHTMLLWSLSFTAAASGLFEIPESYQSENSVLPVTYLQSLKIDKPQEELSPELKNSFACLLIHADETNYEKFNQTYLILTKESVSQLFLTNFPEFDKISPEGFIYMADIREHLINKSACNKL